MCVTRWACINITLTRQVLLLPMICLITLSLSKASSHPHLAEWGSMSFCSSDRTPKPLATAALTTQAPLCTRVAPKITSAHQAGTIAAHNMHDKLQVVQPLPEALLITHLLTEGPLLLLCLDCILQGVAALRPYIFLAKSTCTATRVLPWHAGDGQTGRPLCLRNGLGHVSGCRKPLARL